MKKNIDTERILNPKFAYGSNIIFGDMFRFEPVHDLKEGLKAHPLYLNAMTDRKGNRFERLWVTHFLEPLAKGRKELEELILHSLSFPSSVAFQSVSKEGKDQRVFSMAYINSIFYMLQFLKPNDRKNYLDVYIKERGGMSFSFGEHYRDFDFFMAKYIYQKLEEIRSELLDIKSKGKDSPAYNVLCSLFSEKKDGSVSRGSINLEIANYEKLSYVAKNIVSALEEKVSLDITSELLACYDKDKFLLLFAKFLLDFLMKRIEEKKLKESEITLEEFFPIVSLRNYLEETKDIINYNPVIRYFSGKKETLYTYKKFVKEYQRFLVENKKLFPFLEITDEELDYLSCSYRVEEVQALYKVKYNNTNQLFLPGWEILPQGELLEPRVVKNSSDRKTKKSIQGDTDEIIKRKMLFEKLGPRVQILGKGKFAEYIGYIYNNGLVVFEKFYEDEAQTKQAKEKATYVMNYKNFKDLCLLSKPEIMDYIKKTDNPNVRRVYHTDTWGARMEKIIKGIEYNPAIKREIDLLLGIMDFTKKLS